MMKNFFGIILTLLTFLPEKCYAEFEVLPDLPAPILKSEIVSDWSLKFVSNITQFLQNTNNDFLISILTALLVSIFIILLYKLFKTEKVRSYNKILKGSTNSGIINIVSEVDLGDKKSLYVVEAEGEKMLLGFTGNSIQLLKEFKDDSQFSDCEYKPNSMLTIKEQHTVKPEEYSLYKKYLG